MISLHKNPLIETFDSKSPVYKTVYEQLAKQKKELPPYVPQLLGVIRQNGATEFLYSPNAYKGLDGKKYYSIDYYFSLDNTTFHHTTSIGYNEVAPSKEALLACFDPNQQAARVRFVLDCLKDGLVNPATFWMPRILQEPISEANEDDFKNLLRYLREANTHPEVQMQLARRIELPPAPQIVRILKKTPRQTARELVELGKQCETGEQKDPFKAERCYWRALSLDKNNSLAKRYLALLIYSGQTCCDPTLEFTRNMLEDAYKYSPKNYELNRALAAIYFDGSSKIAPNSTKAAKHLKVCVKSNPNDVWALHILDCLNNRKRAEAQQIQEESAVISIAALYAAQAVSALSTGDVL